MSVPQPLRSKNQMEVHVKARELAAYTAHILKNSKVFDPNVDEELIKRIKNCAYDICVKSWGANRLHADTSREDRVARYRLQEESIILCGDMLVYINIAKSVFHLHRKRMKYWGEMIQNVGALLQKWKESDVDRYGKP